MKEYNVDKKIKKMSRPEISAIFLILIGIFQLFLIKWTSIHSFQDFLSESHVLIFPAIGIAIFVDTTRKVDKIKGNYLKTSSDYFAFKSRGVEKEFNDLTKIKDIQIGSETILIKDQLGNEFIIHLDDFIGKNERKEIVSYFKALKR